MGRSCPGNEESVRRRSYRLGMKITRESHLSNGCAGSAIGNNQPQKNAENAKMLDGNLISWVQFLEACFGLSFWVALHLLGITHLTVSHWKEKGLRKIEELSTSRKALGEELRKKRIELSLTTRQLAKVMGIEEKPSYISLWERSVYYPKPHHRARIVEFLGFDPELSSPTGEN